jgi:hypothetical protein
MSTFDVSSGEEQPMAKKRKLVKGRDWQQAPA